MKELNEMMNELDSLMNSRKESKMKAQIVRIMKRHEFYEKGDLNAVIEKSSEEIADMIERMINDLYNQIRN